MSGRITGHGRRSVMVAREARVNNGPASEIPTTLATSPASRKQSVNLTWIFCGQLRSLSPPFHSFYTFLSFIYFPPVLQASSHLSDQSYSLGASRIPESRLFENILRTVLEIKGILERSNLSSTFRILCSHNIPTI